MGRRNHFDHDLAATTARIKALEARLTSEVAHLKELTALAQLAARSAIDKALEANEKRLDGLNEMRGMLDDSQTHFARQDKVEAIEQRLDAKREAQDQLIDARLKAIESKVSWVGGWVVGAVAFLGLASLIIAKLWK